MAERDEHIDYELIAKFLAGEAVPGEQEQVNDWLSTSEENRTSFSKLKTLWEKTGRIAPHQEADVDVDKGWEKFSETFIKKSSPSYKADSTPENDQDLFRPEILSRDNTKHPPSSVETGAPEAKTRNMRFYFSRIAAVLVLGFGLYWVFESITGAGRRPVTLSSAGEVVTEKLADGSTVSLNIKSQLTYPKSFSRDQRSVSLQGEAFFEVEPNPRQPFVIEVDGAVVKVLGTSFYVKAYDSLSEVTIGVQEGRVEVMPESADRPVILEKGESLSVSKASAEVTPQPFEPNEVYWKSKTLIFQNEHLSEVFSTLEGLYGVNIEVENKDILNCSLTAKFYSEDIEQILEIVNTNFNLTSTHEDNHILISGGGCD